MRSIIIAAAICAAVGIGGVALGAAYGGAVVGPYTVPVYAKGGIFIGDATTNDSTNKLSKLVRCQLDNLDIPSAAASVQANITGTCTGVALGTHVNIAPLQDDAAWDDGTLGAFVESANTVKVTFTADTTGGDPAATNDYEITWWEHP